MNNPTLTEFCFGMIGRADIEGSKSNVAMNAWLPQASSVIPMVAVQSRFHTASLQPGAGLIGGRTLSGGRSSYLRHNTVCVCLRLCERCTAWLVNPSQREGVREPSQLQIISILRVITCRTLDLRRRNYRPSLVSEALRDFPASRRIALQAGIRSNPP